MKKKKKKKPPPPSPQKSDKGKNATLGRLSCVD